MRSLAHAPTASPQVGPARLDPLIRLSPPIPLERARQALRGVVGVYTVLDLVPGASVVLDVGFADDDLTKRLSDPDLVFRWASNARGTLAVAYRAIPGMALEPWVERRRVERSLRRAFRLKRSED